MGGYASPIAFGRLHSEAERAVQSSGVRWTMVRPNGFMQNTRRRRCRLVSSTGRRSTRGWSIVDARDVAAVAVAALPYPGAHAGAAYTVTGAEASSPREQVAIVSQLLRRPLPSWCAPGPER
jgi:uncharacterized protein YbjT (DUF2867 family)